MSDLLLPLLSLLPFIDRNFEEKFAVLKAGPRYGEGARRGYNTMKAALEDGAVVMAWGYVIFLVLCLGFFFWVFLGWVEIVLVGKGNEGCGKWFRKRDYADLFALFRFDLM